ncbi:superoxide dismutase [Brevundimonas lenta]|uniref:Superoxide dismutase n=1 Tax=Brevundimonas lenta TaxID=424796 RepID=A0A7W6NQU7_9CAUL|nr:superoxide dismutase [Brevundimonas lenta]MBB4084318.1 hypothetical protein [Brevundimonas lenta]
MRKTALLTGVAGLFLMTAPAFAQDSTAPQTPAPAAAPAAEQPQSLTLQPGATVRGADGSELGKLEGVRQTEAGQELTVRGADGALRGVPVAGISQQGADVAVAWNNSQYLAAPAIPGAAPAAAEPANPAEPATPADPAEPATSPSAAEPPAAGEAKPDEPGA